MTSPPDLDETSVSELPRDPAEYAVRRRGLPLSFWLMIVFGLVCVGAGVAVGLFGARLFPAKAASESAAPTPTNAAAEAPLGAYGGFMPANPATTAVVPVATASPAAVSALNQRFDSLAADQRRTASAAAEALAAAELSSASQSSRPFADQLDALDRILPDSPALRALRPLSTQPTPSRTALATDFVDQADHVAVLSRAAPKGAGLLAQITHALAGVFTIRRIDKLTGDSPDAILARAQRQVDDGDLEGALITLDALPPAGRRAIAPWRERAIQRIQLDQLVASIRASAAQDLAQVASRGGAS